MLSESQIEEYNHVGAIVVAEEHLVDAGLGDSYEAAHARLAADYLATTVARLKMLSGGALPRLPAASQAAADRLYLQTTANLCQGLEKTVQSYQKSADPAKRQIWRLRNPHFRRSDERNPGETASGP